MAAYHPFDWAAWARAQQTPELRVEIGLAGTVLTLNPATLIVLDGVYSARPELADLVELKVLVEVSDVVRRQRLIVREGQDYMKVWHARWDAAEDYYFTQVCPRESFDFVVVND